MAIKGKKRSQKSRAKRPSAPKPVVVVPRKPVMSRGWVHVVAVAIVAALFGLGFGYGFGKQAKTDTTVAQEANAKKLVTIFDELLSDALKSVGVPNKTGEVSPFPYLKSDLEKVKSGAISPATVSKDVAQATADANSAKLTLTGVNVDKLIEGKPIPAQIRADLASAQRRLSQALTIYQRASADLKDAAHSTGAEQAAALKSAEAMAALAHDLYSDGYEDFARAQRSVGLGSSNLSRQELLEGAGNAPGGFDPTAPQSSLPPGVFPGTPAPFP